ncbi:MAG: recombinase family protein, partial [Candidatus Promineifilaceae bacterium]
PEDQLERTRAYAEKMGYEIVDEGLDVISGTFILARTTFNRYLEMMSEGQLDIIVVDIPDRLGRGDAIAKCELLAELNGGKIVYAQPGRDDSTIEGMALKLTDSLVSGIERINIRRRTMNGKKKWARNGRIIASAYRPYGYRFLKEFDPRTGEKIHCELEIVEEEAEIVLEIFEWCAYSGWTANRIAKELSKRGVLTISDKEPHLRKKKRNLKGHWHKDTVYAMLINTTYKGEWRYMKNVVKRIDTMEGVRTQISQRDEKEMIVVKVPAIVSPELWQLVQDRIQENSRRCFKPTKYKYLLRSLIRCGKCGGAMAAKSRVYKGNRNWHYRCIRRYQYGVNAPDTCSSRNIPGPKVEKLVWEYLVGLLMDEELLFGKIAFQRDEDKEARLGIQQEISRLELQNQKALGKLDVFLELYGEGGLSKSGYLAKKKQIEGEINQRKTEIAKWYERLKEDLPLSPGAEAELRRFQAKIRSRLGQANFKQKRRIFDILRLKCIYHDETGQLVMSGIFGSEALRLDDDDEEDDNQGGKKGGEYSIEAGKVTSQDGELVHITGSFKQKALPLALH